MELPCHPLTLTPNILYSIPYPKPGVNPTPFSYPTPFLTPNPTLTLPHFLTLPQNVTPNPKPYPKPHLNPTPFSYLTPKCYPTPFLNPNPNLNPTPNPYPIPKWNILFLAWVVTEYNYLELPDPPSLVFHTKFLIILRSKISRSDYFLLL